VTCGGSVSSCTATIDIAKLRTRRSGYYALIDASKVTTPPY
jgi:hypothetical protein